MRKNDIRSAYIIAYRQFFHFYLSFFVLFPFHNISHIMSKEQIHASVTLESYEWFFLYHTHSNEGEFSPSFNYTNKVPTHRSLEWGSWAEH